MRAATAKLPAPLLDAVRAVRSRVAKDALPLLTMLQSEPLLMQSSHLSFQEFYCARAIHKGMVLPGEPPWRWSAWWANCLRLGIESGEGFGVGLMRAAGGEPLGTLDLTQLQYYPSSAYGPRVRRNSAVSACRTSAGRGWKGRAGGLVDSEFGRAT